MAYIGKEPIVGNFQKCDAISVVNGQAAYTLQVSSTNVTPESANHMLVSLNGILQAPTTSFTVSGSTLTFASNLATGDVIDFVMLLGNVLDLGVPSDATVTSAKLASNIGISTTGNIATTSSGTITSAGLITASSGVAIGGTGSANTLDDYEEGTWTPVGNTTNGFSTGITQTNNAKYIKIGNLVTVQCYIQMGNSSGNLALEDIVYITGIPFTAANTEASSCCAYRYNSNNGIFAVFLNTTSTIMARCQHVNGSPTRSGGSIAINYTYETA